VVPQQPLRDHVLIIELDRSRSGSAEKTTSAFADVRDKSLDAEMHHGTGLALN
jgi:hypothetical protein